MAHKQHDHNELLRSIGCNETSVHELFLGLVRFVPSTIILRKKSIYITCNYVRDVNFDYFEISWQGFYFFYFYNMKKTKIIVLSCALRFWSVVTVPVVKKNITQSELFFLTHTIFQPFNLNSNPSSFPFLLDSRTCFKRSEEERE